MSSLVFSWYGAGATHWGGGGLGHEDVGWGGQGGGGCHGGQCGGGGQGGRGCAHGGVFCVVCGGIGDTFVS